MSSAQALIDDRNNVVIEAPSIAMPIKTGIFCHKCFRLASLVLAISLISYWGAREYRYQTSPIVPERQAIVAETIELMRANSIVGSQVNWGALQAKATAIADRRGNEIDLDRAFSYVASALEDGHTAYFSRTQAESFNATVAERFTSSITSEVVEVDGVQLVSVNGFLSMDSDLTNVAAGKLRRQVEKAIEATTCGVIVDLTENSGGNMYPMLSGLLPLLPDGVLLQYESAGGARTEVSSNAGAIDFGNQQIVPSVQSKHVLAAKSAPTAIVLGPSTGSAGEMVAIAFKSRSDVRFFGQPTAGALTGNTPYKLKNGGMLALATKWTLDSHGRKYVESLVPDETIVGINSTSKARKRAASWIQSQCGTAISH